MRKIFVLVILVITLPVFGIFTALTAEQAPQTAYVNIEINHGDTLWEIAKTYKPENTSTDKFIKTIKGINSLGSDLIKTGEYLIIPVENTDR